MWNLAWLPTMQITPGYMNFRQNARAESISLSIFLSVVPAHHKRKSSPGHLRPVSYVYQPLVAWRLEVKILYPFANLFARRFIKAVPELHRSKSGNIGDGAYGYAGRAGI